MMFSSQQPIETAAEALARLGELRFERAAAGLAGLTADAAYVADLEDDIVASEELYVGLAVTEIATLRAELGGGPLLG
jgi:hypothetical protein